MTNEVYARRIHALESELARGPRYITNVVTNFVAMPDLDRKGGGGLTRPTTIVEAPEPEQPVVETPRAAPAERARSKPPEETRVASSTREEASRESSGQRNTREASRAAAQRNNAPTASRTTPAPSSSRVRTVHTVKPGDTLARVAQTYGVSVSDLRAANPGLGSGARAGQKINIPNK
jgi:LysM repeat protein